MSAKDLGMIHSANFDFDLSHGDTDTAILDVPGQLTQQLQRMVRQGNFFKIVGIDIGLTPKITGQNSSATVVGELKYYAPTRGRCAAYRAAFKAMAEAMKVQGITMRNNKFYDFRVPLRPDSLYVNTFDNSATFDGVGQLALNAAAPDGLFQVHNSGVQPNQTTATFSEGFGVFGSAGNDFVLNEDQQGYQGNELIADEEFESIPFQISYDQDGSTAVNNSGTTLTMQWRPDPALYLAVLTGCFELDVKETQTVGGDCTISVNVMCSGWKSIMGNPDKKRRSRRSQRKGAKK